MRYGEGRGKHWVGGEGTGKEEKELGRRRRNWEGIGKRGEKLERGKRNWEERIGTRKGEKELGMGEKELGRERWN